jgi:hypothetical protein
MATRRPAATMCRTVFRNTRREDGFSGLAMSPTR